MSFFEGNNDSNTAVAGSVLDGFTGSIPETTDNNDDTYDGGVGSDFIQAGNTNDTLLGGFGRDTLKGGGGADRLDGGPGTDTLSGGDGDDTFFMTDGQLIDDVDGGAGIDTLDLDPASDGSNVDLSAGTYTVVGSAEAASITGVEMVLGTGGADVVNGAAASENFKGNAGADNLNGGDGNDTLNGGSSIDTVSGGNGNDRFVMGEGQFIDDVDGGADSDTLDLSAISSRGAIVNVGSNYRLDDGSGGTRDLNGVETILGTQDDDTITGSSANDTLVGNSGDDRLNGVTGRDSLSGGGGDDVFVMNNGAFIDSVDGGSGTNTLDLSDISSRGAKIDLAAGTWDLSPSFGGPATIDDIDIVIGTRLGDRIVSDFGTQTINGGNGDDIFIVQEGKAIDQLDGGNGADRLDLSTVTSRGANINLATGTWDLSPSFGGPEDISNIEIIVGTQKADTVSGSGLADTMNGGNGNDKLAGGIGNDVLIGSNGADILNGGAGADQFDFNAVADSGLIAATRDTVLGFTHLQDDLDFSTIDARAGVAGNQAFAFIGKAAFTAEGQIRAVQAGPDTILEINTKGANGAEMTIELSNFLASSLSVADFIL